MLVTVSDKKIGVDANNDGQIDYYTADVISAQDYYPFGQLEPGRQYGTLGRYGFNGKEQDPEIKGTGTQYDYGFRIYDPRLGRFLSVDPLFRSFPWYTPYQFAGNRPIFAIDLDGLEDIPATTGHYYTQASLLQMATDDAFNTAPSARGERVVLRQNYFVIHGSGVRENFTHETVLNEGSAGKSINVISQEGTFYENGALATSLEMRSKTEGIYQPSPPQAPVNPAPPSDITHDDHGEETPPTTNQPSVTITPINRTGPARNSIIRRNINFVPSNPQFATPADANTVNQVAANAPNTTVRGRPVTTTTGNTTTTTTTATRTRSIITVDLLTNNNQGSPTAVGNGAQLQTARYNTIRQQLINQGVPARNIRRGTTQFNVPTNQMNGNVNQVNFRINTTRTTTTTGTATTTN